MTQDVTAIWQNCHVGSCQRHKQCQYRPCRAVLFPNSPQRAPANRAEVLAIIACAIIEDDTGWDDISDAILAALEAAGVRLVPAEATRRMINDGIDALNAGTDAFVGADDAYQAAIAASPYAPDVGR